MQQNTVQQIVGSILAQIGELYIALSRISEENSKLKQELEVLKKASEEAK